jgi:hypothetical protein
MFSHFSLIRLQQQQRSRTSVNPVTVQGKHLGSIRCIRYHIPSNYSMMIGQAASPTTTAPLEGEATPVAPHLLSGIFTVGKRTACTRSHARPIHAHMLGHCTACRAARSHARSRPLHGPLAHAGDAACTARSSPLACARSPSCASPTACCTASCSARSSAALPARVRCTARSRTPATPYARM